MVNLLMLIFMVFHCGVKKMLRQTWLLAMAWYVLNFIMRTYIHPNIWFGTHLQKVTKVKNIPRPTSTPDSISCWLYGFGFGFGYYYSTDDHKIVRPYQIFPFDILQIEIFSLKTFTWRTILPDEVNIFNCIVPFSPRTIYCNGAIYWSISHYMKPSIIYFDLADKIFHELPWPESISYNTRDESSGEYYDTSDLWELGTFGEHVSICVHRRVPALICVFSYGPMGDEGVLD